MVRPSFETARDTIRNEFHSQSPALFPYGPRGMKFEQEGETVVLNVKGLIYHGDFHFRSCIIGTDGIVWYHDGMTNHWK